MAKYQIVCHWKKHKLQKSFGKAVMNISTLQKVSDFIENCRKQYCVTLFEKYQDGKLVCKFR